MKSATLLFRCLWLLLFSLPCLGAIAGPSLLPLRAGTELFVDDVNLTRQTNVTRTIHPARKLDKPVLVGEGGVPVRIYGTVHRDAETGEFRMWYGRRYAVSRDGLNWETPLVGIVDARGNATNIVLPKGGGNVLVDELEPDPAKRYKALLAEPIRVGGFSGYYSADGIHWNQYGNDRLFTVGSEIGYVIRDPATRKYFAYIRPFIPRHFPRSVQQKRLGAVLTSDDFIRWSEMKVVLTPDRIDDAWVTSPEQRTEFYGMNGFAYGRSYLGIVPLFRIVGIIEKLHPNQSRYDGPMEGQLITSRDGLAWSRMENRSPIIPSGTDFDVSIMHVATAPLIVDDEIWHYYTAIDGTHGAIEKRITIALARWRLDGFVSLDAGAEEGVVETVMMHPRAAYALEINADASRGTMVVEVVDAAGKVVPGYSGADAIPVNEDNIRRYVRWAEQPFLPDQPFRLRFRFVNASLFSYTLKALPAPRNE